MLLTGVTKFSQVSVFSGFNQPKDISMDGRYEALCGITQDEIDRYFPQPIADMAVDYRCTPEEMKQRLKLQYDGKHVLAVAHGQIIRAIEAQLRGIRPEEMSHIPSMQNAEVRRFVIA